MTDYLKRLIGLSPWSRMHRKAAQEGFAIGMEEGMRIGASVAAGMIISGFATPEDFKDFHHPPQGRTIN
jgi:hypothetical protein